MSTIPTWTKDPNAVLDYEFNWSKWLYTGDTIASRVVTVPTGITLDSSVPADDKVTVWLSGGTAGTKYNVSCRITTTGGRVDERTIRISVAER